MNFLKFSFLAALILPLPVLAVDGSGFGVTTPSSGGGMKSLRFYLSTETVCPAQRGLPARNCSCISNVITRPAPAELEKYSSNSVEYNALVEKVIDVSRYKSSFLGECAARSFEGSTPRNVTTPNNAKGEGGFYNDDRFDSFRSDIINDPRVPVIQVNL